MKKFLLFFSMLILSVGVGYAQDDNDGWKTATPFTWTSEGSTQNGGTTVWYEVPLKGKVAPGENVLLYMNNLDATNAAQVEVSAYTVVVTTVGGKDYTSVNKLTGPESKSISPNRNYAIEISGSIIKNFNLEKVYIKLTTNRKISFSAEPVEPGEKDTECLNAPKLTVSSTPVALNYTSLGKNSWYYIDLKAVKADNTKTVEVTITNTGSAVAHLTAGVSFDCPSTGVTEESTTLAVNGVKTKKLDRKYLDMLADDFILVRVNADQKLSIQAKEVANTEPVVYTDVVSPIALDMEVTYTHAAGLTQWYSVDLKKMGAKLLPEVVVENTEDAKASIDAIVVYETHASAYADRSFTLGAKAVKVQDVERNVVNNAIKMTSEKQGVDTGIVYVRITSDKKITFLARAKKRTEGTACAQAKIFDWVNGNMQGAGTVWYAIDIKEAKEKAQNPATAQDIKLTITNKSSKTAQVDAKVAFDCPYTSTTDASRSIPANQKKDGTLKNSLYKHLATDTIWVGLTTTQNIEFRADFVPAETGDLNFDCKTAEEFDPAGEGKNLVIDNGYDKDTVWFKVALDKVINEKGQLPKVYVVNKGTKTANVRVEGSLDCPCALETMQKRTFTVSTTSPYVQTPTSDLLQSVTADTAWVRVIFDQPIQVYTEWVFEDEGSSCGTATVFDWTIGETYTPDAPHWYAVNIAKAKADPDEKAIRITIHNPTSKSAKVDAEVSFECPVTSATAYHYTAAPGSVKYKDISYSMYGTVKADIIYVKIVSDQKLEISAELVDDDAPSIDICDKATGFDWDNGIDVIVDDVNYAAGDTAWFYLPLDTFEKDNYALVPKVNVENLNPSAKVNIKGIVAFRCHNVKSPMSRELSINAGKTYSKTAERDMVKTYTDPAKKDTVWFGIVTDQDIHVDIEFVNPDQGQDCLHAVSFDWDNGNDQKAGTEVWYDIDLTYIKSKPGKSARIGIHNLDGFTGQVIANMYFTCDDAKEFASYSYNLKANDDKKYEMGRELFTNMAVDHIKLLLSAAQEVHVYAELYDVETIAPIDACLEATPITYNVDITQTKDSMWYVVDLKDIRDYTTGDAELKVTNIDASEAKIKVELSYDCPVVEKMLSRSITLASGNIYTKTAARSVINNTAANNAYLLVTTDKAIKFRLDLLDPRGSSCTNPIEFDWINGNLHAKDSTFWYHVSLDTMKNDVDERDMNLIIENLSTPLQDDVTAELYFDCSEEATVSQSYSFTEDKKEKLVARSFLATSEAWTTGLWIKFTANQNTHLRAELVEKQDPHKEIVNYYDTICPGDVAYSDSLKAEGHTALTPIYEDTVMHDLVVDSIRYTYDKTLSGDSLIYHYVTILKNPVLPKIDDLTAQIDLTAGTVFDLSALTTEIQTKVEGAKKADTQDVEKIDWQYYSDEAASWLALPTTPYSADATQVLLRYAVTTSCGSLIEGDQKAVNLKECRIEVIETKDTVCSGTTFTSYNGVEYTVDENYTIVNETIDYVFTPGVEIGKRVYTYDYKIKVAPAAIVPTATPTASCGAGVDVAAATAELTAAFVPADKATQAVTSIAWKYKDENGDYVDLLPLYPTSVKTIVLHYEATTECGDVVTSADINVTVADDCIHETLVINDTVCSGTEVELYGGATKTVTANETVNFDVPFVKDGRNADSTYTYNLYVYNDLVVPAIATLTEPEAICGEEVDATAAISELQSALAAALAADELASPLVSVKWEVKDANGNWNDVTTSPVTLSPEMTTVDVRYTVDTKCQSGIQNVVSIDVQKRSSENLGSKYAKFTLVSRYGGRLLMVDQKTLQATYPELTGDKVEWYKVVNLYDVENPADEVANPDTKLGTGWYYAPVDADGKSIIAGSGQYYAKVIIDQSATDPCGATVSCNQIITITTAGAAPQLTPNMVVANEPILLSGLNAEETYTVSVYDLMGVLVERFTVTGTDSYTFRAQENVGYYMVGVQAGDMKHTLKYIVK